VVDKFTATLKRVRVLNESTRDFRFERSDGGEVNFEPGQFYRFNFADNRGEFERSYSLCNMGADLVNTSYLDLVISRVDDGRATEILFGHTNGLSVTVSGPYGRLVIPNPKPGRLILVATSVGLAPFMPILSRLFPMPFSPSRSLARSKLERDRMEELAKIDHHQPKPPLDVSLLLGVRTREDFLYEAEILAIQEQEKNFRLILCFSRDELQDPAPYEHPGYVTEQLARLDLDPSRDQLLLCGNPQMIDDCYGKLKEQKFTAKQVHREKYVFAKDKPNKVKAPLTTQQKRLIEEKMAKYR